MTEGAGSYRDLVEKLEGKRLLGKPTCRWEENIKMDLQEVGWGYDWVALAQNKDGWWTLWKVVMNYGVPKCAGNFLTN